MFLKCGREVPARGLRRRLEDLSHQTREGVKGGGGWMGAYG